MQETILKEYDAQLDCMRARGEALRSELISLLRDHDSVKAHSVTLRLKERSSLAHKLVRPDRTYESLWSVTDLVGLRVIVYFEEDVDHVGRLIEAHLPVDFAHSIDKRHREASSFGYRSLHYVCAMAARDDAATLAPEMPAEARFEVQVRTVLEHAWAEIEHDLGYKSASAAPAHVKRRLSRIAGLLELADQEFGAIRDDLREYARVLPERIASNGRSVPLDRVSLGVLLDCDEVRALDDDIARLLGATLGESTFFPDYLLKMLATSGIRSVTDARDGVTRHASVIAAMVKPYFAFAWQAWRLSPTRGGDSIDRGYSLYFLAYAEAICAPSLGVGKVERLTQLYLLDYPNDERAAQRFASELIVAFGDLGLSRAG